MHQPLTHVLLSFPSRCYSPHAAYAQSKLALVLFTYHLQRLLATQGSPVTANVVDPGVVNTNLYRHVFWGTRLIKKLFGWWFFKVGLLRLLGCARLRSTAPQVATPRPRTSRGWVHTQKCEHPRVPGRQHRSLALQPPRVCVWGEGVWIQARISIF